MLNNTMHTDIWDKETQDILRAWNGVSTFWRLFLSFVPRRGGRFFIRFFGYLYPSGRNRDFWFLEEKIFNSHTRMIRTGSGRWDEIQRYLRLCIHHER